MRCKWGSVQEATALWEFMHAVPQGALEEIGLCRVDPAVLRDRYGFSEGRLPPMGASPDGLIRHRPASPASAVRLPGLPCHRRICATTLGWPLLPMEAMLNAEHEGWMIVCRLSQHCAPPLLACQCMTTAAAAAAAVSRSVRWWR